MAVGRLVERVERDAVDVLDGVGGVLLAHDDSNSMGDMSLQYVFFSRAEP